MHNTNTLEHSSVNYIEKMPLNTSSLRKEDKILSKINLNIQREGHGHFKEQFTNLL